MHIVSILTRSLTRTPTDAHETVRLASPVCTLQKLVVQYSRGPLISAPLCPQMATRSRYTLYGHTFDTHTRRASGRAAVVPSVHCDSAIVPHCARPPPRARPVTLLWAPPRPSGGEGEKSTLLSLIYALLMVVTTHLSRAFWQRMMRSQPRGPSCPRASHCLGSTRYACPW